MGKYDDRVKSFGVYTNLELINVLIANELAEANRLKRLELNFNGLMSKLKPEELNYIFNGQLDDKA